MYTTEDKANETGKVAASLISQNSYDATGFRKPAHGVAVRYAKQSSFSCLAILHGIVCRSGVQSTTPSTVVKTGTCFQYTRQPKIHTAFVSSTAVRLQSVLEGSALVSRGCAVRVAAFRGIDGAVPNHHSATRSGASCLCPEREHAVEMRYTTC